MRRRTTRPASQAGLPRAKAPSALRSAGAVQNGSMECGGHDATLASAPDIHALETLPEGWQLKRLREIVDYEKEALNPLKHPYEEFDYYSIPAYQQGDKPTVTSGHEILSLKLVVENGTILFGKLNPRVPKVWLANHTSPRRKIASTEFIPLFPRPGFAASDFLFYLCWSSHVMRKARDLVSGSTPSRQRVDTHSFLDIRVPLPPLPEQRAIAAVLRTVQHAKEACEKVIAATRQLKQSLLHHFFTYGPAPFDQADKVALKETEIGLVPEHWELKRLGEVIERPK